MVSFDSHLKKMSSHWDFLGPLESLGFISWCFPLRYQVCWCVDYVYTYLCSFGVVDFKLCVYRYNRYMCVYNMYMYMYMYTNISMYIYIYIRCMRSLRACFLFCFCIHRVTNMLFPICIPRYMYVQKISEVVFNMKKCL